MKRKIVSAMMQSTKFFDEKISNNGGYVWYYLPDLSRSWGEMEAYSSMLWIQGDGTVAMGNTFLDSYEVTKDEYYYRLAQKVTDVLIKSQLESGGWNYMVDLAGEESIKKWYDTIGKNGWRLEEFQHYYGNATFDDEVTAGVATYLLRFYSTKQDPFYKASLQKSINFILESQYKSGGWPQRYPVIDKFSKNGNADYTPFNTFNDQVIWNNLNFLTACYVVFQDQKFIEPIQRTINFFVMTQQPKPQAGWGMQYSLDLKPAGARTYEPKALDPQFTAEHIEILIKIFEMTGDKKYLSLIPDAFEWIESVKISSIRNDSVYVVPKFVELGTNKGLFIHRKGTNVQCGKYFYDYENANLIKHYNSLRYINIKQVKEDFEETRLVSSEEVIKKSPLVSNDWIKLSPIERFNEVESYMEIPDVAWHPNFEEYDKNVGIDEIISQLDSEGRWLVSHVMVSNPYIGKPKCEDPLSEAYTQTNAGDKYDTSPFRDMTDQKYISTGEYIKNMGILINCLKTSLIRTN